jgi:hypothetical protein
VTTEIAFGGGRAFHVEPFGGAATRVDDRASTETFVRIRASIALDAWGLISPSAAASYKGGPSLCRLGLNGLPATVIDLGSTTAMALDPRPSNPLKHDPVAAS